MHSLNKALITAVIGLVVGFALLVPPLTEGSDFDLRTVFSVNKPVTVPNAVLEPNTDYVMAVGDAHTGMRNVVRIYREDESELVTQFLAINKEQLEPVERTTLNFMETAAGYPQPVESWFYPGRRIGLEFVYSKDQMADIALHMRGNEPTQTAALITESAPAEQPRSDDQAILELDRESQDFPADQPIAPAVPQPDQSAGSNDSELKTTESEEVLRSKPTEESTTTIAQNELPPAQNELPRTAGELPLLALIGSLATGFGIVVRSFRR
jgi:hypothetical protein